jgi:hypothetical protein
MTRASLAALAFAAGLGVLEMGPGSRASAGPIEERFDADAAGFGVFNDALNFGWSPTLGNPGGCISANDDVSGVIWGFVAGPAFLGDLSCFAGGTLAWDSWVNLSGNAGPAEPDISLVGAGLTLVYEFGPALLGGVWTTRSVTLSTAQAWRLNTTTGVLASQAQVNAVLADLDAIRFRIEYRSGADNGRLDNVILSPASGVTCGCDGIDFNNDGASFDPQDIDAFLSVYAEGPCIPASATCSDIDFNNDGALFDPCDIDSFLLVFSEGPCTLCGQ